MVLMLMDVMMVKQFHFYGKTVFTIIKWFIIHSKKRFMSLLQSQERGFYSNTQACALIIVITLWM